jgi:hypothetical protein
MEQESRPRERTNPVFSILLPQWPQRSDVVAVVFLYEWVSGK